MKNLIFILLIILSLPKVIKAQENKISAFSHYSDNNVCFRFGLDNYDDFEHIKQFGFTIQRMTLIVGTDTLPLSGQQQSMVTIMSHLKPKDQQWIENNIAQTNFRDLLISAIYSNSSDSLINFESPKLVDAVNKLKQDQGRLFAIIYAAEQNFELAKSAGLGFIDQSASPNCVYQYFISIQDSLGNNYIDQIGKRVSTFQPDIFKPVKDLKVLAKPGNIEIAWIKTDDTKYSSYDIFRSTDSITFSKINSIPFVYFKTDDVKSNEVVYVDSVASGVKYYYKVHGISPFGTYSQATNIVSATALFPRLADFSINILEPSPTMTEVPLNWEVTESLIDKIVGFDIYRSDFYDGTYIKLNANTLSPSLRNFVDQNPLVVGYYYIEAKDNNDYSYVSSPKLISLPDSIPPAAPQGVTAKYYGNSKVEIKWSENTETDLAGYRIEMSNQRNGTFVQITEKFITENEFNYYSDPNVVSDSIFFRVFAQDHRGNYSEKSVPNGCKRPDVVPPAKPNLSKAMADDKGIKLGWTYSPTESVIGYKLERRPDNAPDWVTVVSFSSADKNMYMPTDSTAFNFIDTTALEQRPYEYRFIAQEAGGISSSSAPIVVTPLPVTVSKTTISNFSITETTESGIPNPIIQRQLQNLRRATGENRYSEANNTKHHVILKFTYNLDPNVADFQIYRSISGNNIALYKTVSLTEALGLDPQTQQVVVEEDLGPTIFTIQDKDLMTGRRYTYQVVARHKDLSTTPRSIALSKKIEAN